MATHDNNGQQAAAPGATPKVDAQRLSLRAGPRPVSRINRRVLLALSATTLALVIGAVVFALDPPRLFEKGKKAVELYQAGNPPKPEGLENLPRRYSDLAKGDLLKPVPKLGPPLPGDLGAGVLGVERDLGVAEAPRPPFRPDPEEDAARAERIRQARLAQQGRESKVFFQLGTKAGGGRQNAVPSAGSAGTPAMAATHNRNPFGVADGGGTQQANGGDPARSGGDQARKQAFLKRRDGAGVINPHALRDPASPYQLMAGTIIPASLITGINSDLPGRVIAQVTENVYDTVSGRHLLIPQGARVIGTYDSTIAFGQNRALIVWQRIIMPDGSSISIDNLPASDTAGHAGLKDKVDVHTWQLLKGVVLATVLGVSSELTFGKEEGDLVKAIRQSSQKSVNQAGQRLVERSLDIQPTITIRPGWPLRIIVQSDLILRPYDEGKEQP